MANPEVRSSGRIHSVALYSSTRPDLQIRINHCSKATTWKTSQLLNSYYVKVTYITFCSAVIIKMVLDRNCTLYYSSTCVCNWSLFPPKQKNLQLVCLVILEDKSFWFLWQQFISSFQEIGRTNDNESIFVKYCNQWHK